MIDNTINDAVTIAGGEGTLLANRYRIVRQLGQGGMGNVWLVEDTQLDNKLFAVKMLPAILVANKRAYRQLKDEALVAMRLVHPNIVQIRAFEENDGNPFLVMDYVDGQTLDDYLAEHAPAPLSPGSALGERALPLGKTGTTGVSPVAGGLPDADVLRILTPIADALDYAHGEGVVHRDVKPANVMIRKDGHPFILDFGIAREIQETITRVTGKLSSGTLLYMSPEQLNGALPKPAQDVYSFAAMVYECLKGEPPFVRGQIEHQILNNPPEPLPGGTQLVASVMAGLAKKPEDRPATCAAVLRGSGAPAASVRTANGSGRSAASPSPQQPGGSRSRATAAILVAALLAILGGVWWAITRTDDSPVQDVPVHVQDVPVQENTPFIFGSTNAVAVTNESMPRSANNHPLFTGEAPVQKPQEIHPGATTNEVGHSPSGNPPLRPIPEPNVHVGIASEIAAALTAARSCATPQDARETLSYAAEALGSAEALYERARVDDLLGWGAFVRTREEKERKPPWTSWLRRIDLLGEKKAVFMQPPSTNDLVYRASALKGYREAAARGVSAAVDALARHATHEQDKNVRRCNTTKTAKAAQEEWEQRVRRGTEPADNEHPEVQLWEGGPSWADRNIGAEEPWESGYYFWWGDTIGYKRVNDMWVASNGSTSGFSFEEGNTPTYKKNVASLESERWITGDGVLAPKHDAAHVQWGGGWRMPTKEELQDLLDKCDWTWTTTNGVNGYVVRGRGDYASESIFLPAAGFGSGRLLYAAGSRGYYWSSVPNSGGSGYAWDLDFYSGGHRTHDNNHSDGQSVRPVQGVTK